MMDLYLAKQIRIYFLILPILLYRCLPLFHPHFPSLSFHYSIVMPIILNIGCYEQFALYAKHVELSNFFFLIAITNV